MRNPGNLEKPAEKPAEKPVSQPVSEPKKKRPTPEVTQKQPDTVEPVIIKKSYTKKAAKKVTPSENQNVKNTDVVELPKYEPQNDITPQPIIQPDNQPIIQPQPVVQQEIIELPPAPTATEGKIPVVVADVKYKKKSFDLYPEIKEVRRKYEPLVKIEAPKFTSEKKHRTLYKQRF